MAQLAFRQGIASDMFEGLVDAGMADDGAYTPPGVGGTPVACRVVIDRGRAPFGTFGSVPGNTTTIRLLCSEVPTPKAGGVVAADGGTFKLVKELANNGALAMWEVAV